MVGAFTAYARTAASTRLDRKRGKVTVVLTVMRMLRISCAMLTMYAADLPRTARHSRLPGPVRTQELQIPVRGKYGVPRPGGGSIQCACSDSDKYGKSGPCHATSLTSAGEVVTSRYACRSCT